METYILIEHDNGMPGYRGFTDMAESEMLSEYGGIDALKASYEASGIHIYGIFFGTR